MAIIEAEARVKPRIDLSGPDGNVFVLIAYARSYCCELEIAFRQLQEEMTSGTYHHALFAFNKHFGEHVDIMLPPGISEQDIILAELSR